MDDLDRLIDEAARQMAQHEPSDALSGAVMERVAAGGRPSSQRWLGWGSVAAATALAGVVMFVSGHRRTPDSGLQAPDSGPRTTDSGLRTAGVGSAGEAAGQRESPEPGARSPEPAGAPVDDMAVPAIDDAIVFDTITPEPIEVDDFQATVVTSIVPIEVAPIEVEPISASND